LSGIAGIIHLDRRHVTPTELHNMGVAMKHRGVDYISEHVFDHGGLTQCMLYTTHNSFLEKLPFVDVESRISIVADARLDNRSELAGLLVISDKELANLPDSQLLLRAFKKWGSSCAERLQGDFSFAIWDDLNKQLFCCRDHMGINPFYYYHCGDLFIFASEIKAILTNHHIQKKINEERVADYLACIVTEKESTFYQNIYRLPPAHHLSFGKKGFFKNSYWNLSYTQQSTESFENQAEELRELFTRAISNRICSPFEIGSSLSGGLDSSSIVSVAADIFKKEQKNKKLHTFSGIFNTLTECDEREYIDAIIRENRNQIIPHFIPVDAIRPGKLFEHVAEFEDEPFYVPHFFMGYEILKNASKNKVRIFLDGHDGDSAISYGLGLFPELLKKMKFKTAFMESVHIHRSRKQSLIYLLNTGKQIIQRSSILSCLLSRNPPKTPAILSPSFAKQTGIQDRFHDYRKKTNTGGLNEWESHYIGLTTPLQTHAIDFLNRFGSQFHINTTFPFYDPNVLQHCLNLPAESKLHHGLNRYIMRSAIGHLLPNKVFARKYKTDFSQSSRYAFKVNDKKWLEDSKQSIPQDIFTFVDRKVWEESWRQYFDFSVKTPMNIGVIFKSLSLGMWLNKN
jgi:asparagine synthase (glutamine-hydrolysing)